MQKMYTIVSLSVLFACSSGLAMQDNSNNNNAPAPTETNEFPTQQRINAFVANAHRCMENVRKGSVESELTATSLDDQTMNLETLDEIQARRERIRKAKSIEAIHPSIAYQAKYSHQTAPCTTTAHDFSEREALLEMYKRDNNIDALLKSSRLTAAKMREANAYAYEICENDRGLERADVEAAFSSDSAEDVNAIVARIKMNALETNQLLGQLSQRSYPEGDYDYTVPEDYAVEQSNVNYSINNNNVDTRQLAPATIRNAEELLQAELRLNPKNAFTIFLRYFNAHPASISERKGNLNNTPLHECAFSTVNLFGTREGNLTLLGMVALLSAGADKAALNNEKVSPFDIILNSGNEMLIQLITTENPTPDTVLNLALEHGNEDLIQLLLN